MSNKKTVSIQARYLVKLPAQFLSLVDRTQDPVRIHGTRYSRYTFRGVPGRLCDLIVADCLESHRQEPESVVLEISDQRPHELSPAHADLVMEIGIKKGKYDGSERRRYALRYFREKDLGGIEQADLRLVATEEELLVIVRPRDGSAPIVDTWPRLRSFQVGDDLSKIIGHHWRSWYTHLTDQEQMREFCDQWESEMLLDSRWAGYTLAEINRKASRDLYRLSRDLGYRKLTRDDKLRLGLDLYSAQWQHEDVLLPLMAARGINALNAIGVSDDPSMEAEADEYEMIQAEFDAALYG